MDPSTSLTQIHCLAESARCKLDYQVRAQNHNLRVLIGHARLYDRLDDHVEQLRARRGEGSFARSHSTKSGLAMSHPESPQTFKQAKADIYEAMEEMEDEDWESMGITSDCAVIEGIDPDDLAESNDKGIHFFDREDSLFDTHGRPTIIDASCPFVPKTEPIWRDATLQASVTETAVEHTSVSGSRPDSKPYSERDDVLKGLLDTTRKIDTAKPDPWWRKFYSQRVSSIES
ncbi:MAG: hypothetical protein Q9220_006797 [cf. Caloplaca sp. 1 TL-2023]